MQIILINYTGRHGGGPLNAYEMTKALTGQGARVAAVISDQADNLEEWKQLSIDKLVMIPTYDSPASFIKNHIQFNLYKKYQIRKELEKYEVKAIYCPMCTFWTYAVNRLFPAAKKYVVCHDPVLHTGEVYALAYKLCGVDRSYQTADEILVHSKRFIRYAERRYHKTGHVHYMPLGRHSFYNQIRKKQRLVRYEKDKTNFVFFGRISKYKGLDILAQAYQRVSSQCEDVTLTVIGEGDFRPYQKQYQVLPHVRVINRWVENCEVESIFQGENLIAVFPYTDATQSGALLVAMECGVPVIASDAGGLAGQIEHGVTGLLAATGDSKNFAKRMMELKNDRELYQKIRANISKKLQDMEWPALADRLLALMEWKDDGYEA